MSLENKIEDLHTSIERLIEVLTSGEASSIAAKTEGKPEPKPKATRAPKPKAVETAPEPEVADESPTVSFDELKEGMIKVLKDKGHAVGKQCLLGAGRLSEVPEADYPKVKAAIDAALAA